MTCIHPHQRRERINNTEEKGKERENEGGKRRERKEIFTQIVLRRKNERGSEGGKESKRERERN